MKLLLWYGHLLSFWLSIYFYFCYLFKYYIFVTDLTKLKNFYCCIFLLIYRNVIVLQAADKSLELLGALRSQRDKKGQTVTGLWFKCCCSVHRLVLALDSKKLKFHVTSFLVRMLADMHYMPTSSWGACWATLSLITRLPDWSARGVLWCNAVCLSCRIPRARRTPFCAHHVRLFADILARIFASMSDVQFSREDPREDATRKWVLWNSSFPPSVRSPLVDNERIVTPVSSFLWLWSLLIVGYLEEYLAWKMPMPLILKASRKTKRRKLKATV